MSSRIYAAIKGMLFEKPAIAAAVSAVAALFFAISFLHEREEAIMQVNEPAKVAIAARDMAPGEAIDEGSIGISEVPQRFVQPAAFGSVREAAGRIAATPIRAGAHLTRANARRPSELHRLAGLLPIGRRAAVISIDDGAAARFVRPDDLVDVMATLDLGSEASVRRTTLTIVSAAQVLAVGDDVADALPEPPARSQSRGIFNSSVEAPSRQIQGALALAVTPAEAQALAFAVASGKLSIAIRPMAEGEDADAVQPTTIATITGNRDDLVLMKRGFREYRGR